jgi:hypothetical protein
VETLWDYFWFMLLAFLWIAWIMLVFRVFGDIFRTDRSGVSKAAWSIFIILLPFIGVLVYLIAEGGNMTRRDIERAAAFEDMQRSYIRSVAAGGGAAGGGAADELEKLAGLRERGVISDAEFEQQKAKLLA